MLSFAGGMQELVDALARELSDAILLNQRVVKIDRIDDGYRLTSQSLLGIERRTATHLLLTIPAHSFEDVDFGFDFSIADALSSIEYPPVTSVFFGYREAELGSPLDGFGVLTPSVEGRRILGTIWNSSLFSGRAPQSDGVAEGVAMTTFVGGSRQPEIALWEDDRLNRGGVSGTALSDRPAPLSRRGDHTALAAGHPTVPAWTRFPDGTARNLRATLPRSVCQWKLSQGDFSRQLRRGGRIAELAHRRPDIGKHSTFGAQGCR